MKPEALTDHQIIELWRKFKTLPRAEGCGPLSYAAAVYSMEQTHFANAEPSLRIAWANALRDILNRVAPRNKMGSPLVSDIDLLLATLPQRAEAIIRAFEPKWRLPEPEGGSKA